MKERVRQERAAILARWLELAIDSYPPETAAFLRREDDRFANPVGQTLADGMQAVLDDLLDDSDPTTICHHLDEIIRVRAIQEFAPSQAISFVFLLKQAVRDVLMADPDDPDAPAPAIEAVDVADQERFDAEVDQVALYAFDIYCTCREQMYRLRINEIRRGFDVNVTGEAQVVRGPFERTRRAPDNHR